MAELTPDQLERFHKPGGGWAYSAGVYRLYNSAGVLLYMGLGANPAERVKAHAKQAEWWPEVDVAKSSVEWFRRYEDASMAEKLAIRLEAPKYNVTGSKTRPHWSHERGATPRKGDIADGAVLPMGDAVRYHIENIVLSAKVSRRCLYLARRHTPAAAVVPIELAQLAQRIGGADAAAMVLLRHLTETLEPTPATPSVSPADLTDGQLVAEISRRLRLSRES